MRLSLIIAIILSILLAIFALANNVDTDVNFLFTTVTMPLSLLLLITLAAGVLIMFLFNIPSWWRHRQEKSVLKKEIKQLTMQLEANQNQAVDDETQLQQDDFVNDVEKE